MQKPDLGKIVIREAFIIVSCLVAAFGLGRLGKYIPSIGADFFSIKLAGLLYLASIVCRIAGFFIRMTLIVAVILGAIGIILLFLVARYPGFFAFLK